MLTIPEAAAHVAILDTIRLVKDGRLHRVYVPGALRGPLEQFRPRCQVCRDVLHVGQWVDGLRRFACRCGVYFLEAA